MSVDKAPEYQGIKKFSINAKVKKRRAEAKSRRELNTKTSKGERDMTHERFKQNMKVMEEVHEIKNRQYAGGNGYLSNLRMCEAMGIPAWKGVIVRMTDKMAKLMNLSNSEGSELQKEVTDAFIDMGVYSGMGLIAYQDFLSADRDGKSSRDGKPAKTRSSRRKKRIIEAPEPPNALAEGAQAEIR